MYISFNMFHQYIKIHTHITVANVLSSIQKCSWRSLEMDNTPKIKIKCAPRLHTMYTKGVNIRFDSTVGLMYPFKPNGISTPYISTSLFTMLGCWVVI